MKYFLKIIGLLPAIALAGSAIAPFPVVAQSCANYWVNPQTGQQECLTVTPKKSKPSFLYLGKSNNMNRDGKKVTAKFYVQKNVSVTSRLSGLTEPFLQVTIFSHGYRLDDEVVLDCNSYAIAYKSEAVSYKGRLKEKNEYKTLDFEPIRGEGNSATQRMYDYICNGIIPNPRNPS